MPIGLRLLIAFFLSLAALVFVVTEGSAIFQNNPVAWLDPDSVGDILLAAAVCAFLLVARGKPPTPIPKDRPR